MTDEAKTTPESGAEAVGSAAAERDSERGARLAAASEPLDAVVGDAQRSLAALQREDGQWLFELEADATIPSDYIFLNHFLGEIEDEVEAKIARYLRTTRGDDGGWPLFHDGDADLSATVKAYFALKLVGDSPDAPHMKRAREAVLARGGAARCNVFTRIMLALFGEVPWRAVPVMPAEILLLPRSFPVHLSKVSYWSRTVIAPLVVLMALKPRAANPRRVTIRELFTIPPEKERRYMVNPTGAPLGEALLVVDTILRRLEPMAPRGLRRRAVDAAVAFVTERLNGEYGVGGIFPAMANTVMAFHALGYPPDHPDLAMAKRSVRNLLADHGESAYCQPCLSAVWDTALAAHAMMEAGEPASGEVVGRALDWLVGRQVVSAPGDWIWRRPDLAPGGWPFGYRNDYYPDLDDTAVAVMALARAETARHPEAIDRGVEWILGMQSRNGGWGAYDADNTYHYLNNIPFADHGALIDPPTVDVTARCLGTLAQLGYGRDHSAVQRALAYLRSEQEQDGSWYGRWGINYVYGTWSALCAFNAAGEEMQAPHIRRAVDWLKSRQRPDGGWGEDEATYWPDRRGEAKESTPSQTSWALLGLMAAGEVDSDAVQRGVAYLLKAPRDGAKWREAAYTGIGFPRVFYLRYHGYSAYFPLWALARFRDLKRRNLNTVPCGM
ncbi:MAG: squalene--hopene cyclase [Alphaproteobacteria bacterium]